MLEDSDGWLRRKLRCLLWRQWKRPFTRARKTLMQRGTDAGAGVALGDQRARPVVERRRVHMNAAFPKSYFDRMGLVSLLDTVQRLQCVS